MADDHDRSFREAQNSVRQRIDPDLEDALTAHEKNERAGIAFVNEVMGPHGGAVDRKNRHDVEVVRVEFGLLYGDETFTRRFVRPRYEQNHPDTPALEKLLDETGARFGDIEDLFLKEVPVTVDRNGDWVLDFDVENTAEPAPDPDPSTPTSQSGSGSDSTSESDGGGGVSPVVGVILMVGVTVVIAAVVGTFVLSMASDLEAESSASVSFDESAADRTVEATWIGSGGAYDTADFDRLEVVVEPDSGGATTQYINEPGESATFRLDDGVDHADVKVVGITDDGEKQVVGQYTATFDG